MFALPLLMVCSVLLSLIKSTQAAYGLINLPHDLLSLAHGMLSLGSHFQDLSDHLGAASSRIHSLPDKILPELQFSIGL
jgi:hypothetical protein